MRWRETTTEEAKQNRKRGKMKKRKSEKQRKGMPDEKNEPHCSFNARCIDRAIMNQGVLLSGACLACPQCASFFYWFSISSGFKLMFLFWSWYTFNMDDTVQFLFSCIVLYTTSEVSPISVHHITASTTK